MTQRIILQCEHFYAEYDYHDNGMEVIRQIELDELFGSITPYEAFRLRFAVYKLMNEQRQPAAPSKRMMGIGLARRAGAFVNWIVERIVG